MSRAGPGRRCCDRSVPWAAVRAACAVHIYARHKADLAHAVRVAHEQWLVARGEALLRSLGARVIPRGDKIAHRDGLVLVRARRGRRHERLRSLEARGGGLGKVFLELIAVDAA